LSFLFLFAKMPRYDMVVFGASGFTGQFVVEYLARAVKKDSDQNSDRPPLSWAISGRSEAKLKAVLKQASKVTGIDLNNIPIIICDTSDEESVSNMCRYLKFEMDTTAYAEYVVDFFF
jgi:short subunit dehydrogenase-like uncharacterized protein